MQRKLLSHFSWEKAGLDGAQQGYRIVTLCAAIKGARRCTAKQLAGELQWSTVIVDRTGELCVGLGLMEIAQPKGADAALGAMPTVLYNGFKPRQAPGPVE